MKGLEISEIRKSQLNGDIRIDSEYFLKDDLTAIGRVRDFGSFEIGDCVTDGIHTSIDYDEKSPIRLLSAQSPRENYIDVSRDARISADAHNANPRTALRINDVVVSSVGTIGNCAVVEADVLPANCDRDIAIIRKADCSPYVLSTFLVSKYGRCQTLRETTGNVQQHLFLYKIRELLVPIFSQEFQDALERIVKRGYTNRRDADITYKDAEAHLLRELGFEGWEPPSKTVAVRKYSDFISAARFDAEYFQPDCDAVAHKLAEYPHGCVLASEMLQTGLVKNGTGAKEKYVELADIGASGEIIGCTQAHFEELPSRARQRIHAGDVIVSSIEGSLERCALVDDEYDGALCSTGFHRFRSADINAETLMLLFKSAPIQRLLKRGCSGTILCGILPGEFKRISIPVIKKSVQVELAKKVQSSVAARKESKRLLELAKNAVEVAIEKGEEAGLKLLM